jgi:hypothetical protein
MLFSRLARLVVLAICVDFSEVESRTPAARIWPQAPSALLRLRVVGPLLAPVPLLPLLLPTRLSRSSFCRWSSAARRAHASCLLARLCLFCPRSPAPRSPPCFAALPYRVRLLLQRRSDACDWFPRLVPWHSVVGSAPLDECLQPPASAPDIANSHCIVCDLLWRRVASNAG